MFCLANVNAQKVVKKSIVNPEISHIQIDTKNCFELDLSTTDSDELMVEAHIDGEYTKDLLLQVSEDGSSLMVSAAFQPNFVNPNDKLSAHKVVSIALKVDIPKSKNVNVFGTSCNVKASGNYDILQVSLNDGRCELNKVTETVEVITQSGPIFASYNNTSVQADSKYGKVTGVESKKGNGQYMLSSVTGNIHLERIE